MKKPARTLRLLNYTWKLRSKLKYKQYQLYLNSINYLDWSVIRVPDRLFFLYFVLRPILWLVRPFKAGSKTR
jgi:hypothetical protein